MRRSSTLLLTTLALIALPCTAAAQQTDATRGGVHFSIGLGAGSVSASCPGCEVDFFQDRLTGVSGVLQLGFFATPKLAVTAELMGWMNNDDPVYRRVAGWGVGVLGYPSETSGFFVKGSVGGLRAIADDDTLLVQTDAWMATTGVGYDMPVAEKVSLTLYGNYVRGFGGATWVNGISSDLVVTPNTIQVGAGLTIH